MFLNQIYEDHSLFLTQAMISGSPKVNVFHILLTSCFRFLEAKRSDLRVSDVNRPCHMEAYLPQTLKLVYERDSPHRMAPKASSFAS